MASKNGFKDHLGDLGSDAVPALAFVECSSISRGLFLTDLLLKKAPVRVITSQPISSGKHVVLFCGDVASVEESYNAVLESADDCILRNVFIQSVHPRLVPYLDSLWEWDGLSSSVSGSVGIVESSSLAGAVLSADRALKTARVDLCRFRLGQGIGGKAFFVLNGPQEEVEAAVQSANECLVELESLCRTDLIANPLNESLEFF